MNDYLDAVPYNKISAFGGDYLTSSRFRTLLCT